MYEAYRREHLFIYLFKKKHTSAPFSSSVPCPPPSKQKGPLP